nr:unnamed protein product [Leishmania braziliensis]
MGNGVSSPSPADSATSSSARASYPAATRGPRVKKILVNAAPRASASSFPSPASMATASTYRQARAQTPEAKSASLQITAVQRRQQIPGVNGTGRAAGSAARGHARNEEDLLLAFTRNADPISLRVLGLIQQADAVPQNIPSEKLRLLQQCYPLLETVPKCRFDQLAVTVYQKEGDIYYQQEDIENAKSTYSRAITLAEKRVARQDTDMYMVLKRYVLAMVGLSRIWYDHERDHKGFTFVDHKHPKVPAVDGGDATEDANSSMSSLESSLMSDGGSVFSLNEAILKSMAPRPPRRQTGPFFQRVKVRAPHVTQNVKPNREDEFVLHSRMTRELVASPCELLLLRCCEVVQIGHNSQSELLIPAQIALAQIYEELALYSRALLLVRRCVGILCSVYDYDHPWVVYLMQRADRLEELLEEQLRSNMATKIQATWRMYQAMQQLENVLGHPVRRHQWIPRKYRATPDLNFLEDFVDDMPSDGLLGDAADDGVYGGLGVNREGREQQTTKGSVTVPEQTAMVPQTAPVRETEWHSAEPHYPADVLVRYAPAENAESGDTFTTVVPNATVVGTTQDTQTDTDVQHTEYGDVLTVRTTTITKTITEDVVSSIDNDSDDESSEDEGQPTAPLRGGAPPPPPQQQKQPRGTTYPAHPPPQAAASYSSASSVGKYEEERECLWAERAPKEPQQQRQEQTQVKPRGHAVSTQARRPPPQTSLQAETTEQRRKEKEQPRTSRQAVATSSLLQRRESATQRNPGNGANRSTVHQPEQPPPKAARPRLHPYSSREDENAFGDELSRPAQRGAPPQQQPAPPMRDHYSALVAPSSNGSNDEEYDVAPLEGYRDGTAPHQVGESNEVIGGTDVRSSSSEVSPLYVRAGNYKSRRESFQDLVVPNAAYRRESNGCPVFLPPLGYRRRSERSSQSSSMPPPGSESNELVLHPLVHNGSRSPQVQKAPMQPNDPRYRGDHSGMPVYPTAPTNTYPSAHPYVAQAPQTTKTTRDYKIIKRRRVRTYVRESVVSSSTNGENTSSSSSSVNINERMSSASWEEDSASSSSSSSTHVVYVEEAEQTDAASDNSKPNSTSAPRQQQQQPSKQKPARRLSVPHRPHKPRRPTPPKKSLSKTTGNGSGAAAR